MKGTVQTIELDCPPGSPRPGDLINAVVRGTPLEGKVPADPFTFFGCWQWTWTMPEAEWVSTVQPVIRPRIERLYANGVIRYGSW